MRMLGGCGHDSCRRRHRYMAAILGMHLLSRSIPNILAYTIAKHGLLSTRVSPSSSSWFRWSVTATNNCKTLEWKGSSHSTSTFASHVLVSSQEAPVKVVDVVDRVLQEQRRLASSLSSSASSSSSNPTSTAATATVTDLAAAALIHLGSVWYLPASAPRDPAYGVKPKRLTAEDANQILEARDYLRIHHDPRRFPVVDDYDWAKGIDEKRGVIVAADAAKGWLVIDKPAGVPVHMTVDNAQENVASCIMRSLLQQQQQQSQHNKHVPLYVATPQRLDQNTSGLLVVATSQNFAAYFAQLLRYKTAKLLEQGADHADQSVTGGVYKLYRCLVCLVPPPKIEDESSSWSVNAAVADLHSYAETKKVLRHYLEPSMRAPKRFVSQRPAGTDWPESLLKIRRASAIYALVGSEAGSNLAQSLWNSTLVEGMNVPLNCPAVMELEIELLTGRTHQIRGQLAACHYPLVGDVQYGGARPFSDEDIARYRNQHEYFLNSERLALQCCELDFVDPDVVTKYDGTTNMTRSERWNRFRLEKAWWTPLLEQYDKEMQSIVPEKATTSALDVPASNSNVKTTTTATSSRKAPRPDLLPPRVSLSPGANKYVLIRAMHPAAAMDQGAEWFVKSAAPHECGGPYHGKSQKH